MFRRLILVGLSAALLAALAACAAPWGSPTLPADSGYPPSNEPAPPAEDAYPMGERTPGPMPGKGDETPPADGASGQSVSLFPPEPADEQRARGPMFIDLASLMTHPEQAGAFNVAVEGSLPTPCNLPRAVVNPPDAQNIIRVEAFSVMDQDKACIERIEPFGAVIATLAGYPSGTYTVMVNEVNAGEIRIP